MPIGRRMNRTGAAVAPLIALSLALAACASPPVGPQEPESSASPEEEQSATPEETPAASPEDEEASIGTVTLTLDGEELGDDWAATATCVWGNDLATIQTAGAEDPAAENALRGIIEVDDAGSVTPSLFHLSIDGESLAQDRESDATSGTLEGDRLDLRVDMSLAAAEDHVLEITGTCDR